MIDIFDVIPNMSIGIQDLFPENAYHLIMSWRNSREEFNPEVYKKIFSPEQLLLEKKSRTAIINNLNTRQTNELVDFLNIPSDLRAKSKTLNDSVLAWLKPPTKEKLRKFFEAFGATLPEKEETEPKEAIKEIYPDHGLYEHQLDVVLRTEKLLEKGHSRMLIHMPTGSGKTRTAMYLVCKYLNKNTNRVVIWLADTEELCEQARNEFEKSWKSYGNRPIGSYGKYGQVDADLTHVKEGFLSMSLQTAWSRIKARKEDIKHLKQIKPLVIFDEAHKALAQTYKDVLNFFAPNDLMSVGTSTAIGLTATPGRRDEEGSKALSKLFGKNKISLEDPRSQGSKLNSSPIDYLISNGFIANPTSRRLESKFDIHKFKEFVNKTEGDPFTPKEIKKLEEYAANDHDRTMLLLSEALSLLKTHKRVLLFAASVEQAKCLSCAINAFSDKDTSRVLEAGTYNRAAYIDWFNRKDEKHKILCNYGILTTGFDSPQVDAVLIGRPTTSVALYSQMVGRGLRGPRAGGNKTAEIVTVVDIGLPAFGDIRQAFRNWDRFWKD